MIPTNSIVVLEEWWKKELQPADLRQRFGKDDKFFYLGEIPNCLGHCIVIGFWTGKVYPMYHSESFRLATEFEING